MKHSLQAVLILVVSLLAFFLLSLILGGDGGRGFRTLRTSSLFPADSCVTADSTLAAPSADEPGAEEAVTDTSAQSILYFGDSMLEWSAYRLAEYAKDNGHKLHCAIWYGSTSKEWGSSTVLDTLIMEHKPTFIFVCMGGNELFVKDLESREGYVRNIVKMIGDIPYVWMGPPNWKPDTGINDVQLKVCGPRHYYPSYKLTFGREKDQMHPDRKSSYEWMDAVVLWMKEGNSTRMIKMDAPHSKYIAPTIEIIQSNRRFIRTENK